MVPTVTTLANCKFTGKERDSETGLDYFGARYYGSNMGRFLSPDEFPGGPVDLFDLDDPTSQVLPYANILNPQSLNKYAYTYNNPLRYIDPDGHDSGDPVKMTPAEAQQAAAMAFSVTTDATFPWTKINKKGNPIPPSSAEQKRMCGTCVPATPAQVGSIYLFKPAPKPPKPSKRQKLHHRKKQKT